MPEEDARRRSKGFASVLKHLNNFPNKILLKRPDCCQIETEEYEAKKQF